MKQSGHMGIIEVSACLLFGLVPGAFPAQPTWAQIEADWLRQAEAWGPRPTPAQADAAGAVDGVKNGKYAFHTAQEPHPWWQVDLGESLPISRIIVFNRLDYAPGLHNADHLRILTSEDGQAWNLVHDTQGAHFGGISGAPPLQVDLPAGQVQGRFLRLQVGSAAPVFFHLDEVEIFGPLDPARNLALHQPADQSSVSVWSTAKTTGPDRGDPLPLPAVEHFLERGRLLAADLRQAGVETGPFERQLDDAAAALRTMPTNAPTEGKRALYFRVRWAMRRMAFCNPLLDFDRLLMVKRFGQETYPDVCLNHMPWVSRPGGDICVLTLAGPEGVPEVQNVLLGALGPGHVHGLDLSWDGTRVVFGYAKARSPEPPQGWLDRASNFELRRTEEPTHLYEIAVDGTGLRQLTDSRDWSDLDPTYTPNGDIAFVSERCGCSLQCNEWDKDETSCNLYIMGPDGSGLRRLSVTKDGDYLPHTLDDGTIGYTRWEYQERGWARIQSIWFVRPDGTGADALFKQHLNDPWALEDMRSIPGTFGQKLVSIATGHHTLPAGPVVVVTPSVGLNDPRGIDIVTPGVYPPEGGMSGSPVSPGGVFDRGGYYMSPWALSEKTFLVSYSFGTGKSGVASEIDPTGYGLYLIDVFGTKELLYRDPGISCYTPIPLRPRPRPPVLASPVQPANKDAVLALASAAYGVPGLESRKARYLRVASRLPWPYDNSHGGQRYAEKAHPNNWTPVRVLGLVPLEPDGSAHFRVPADTAVYFQLLDENFMELRRMRSFISFQPGEVRGCVGCHETRAEAPPAGRWPLAFQRDAVTPDPPPWGSGPISFLRDVQPILDKHCVRCHSGLTPDGGLDFFVGLTSGWAGQESPIVDYGHNRAFETIIQSKLVSWSDVQGDAHVTQPFEQGSHQSKLIAVVEKGMRKGSYSLSETEWQTLVAWVDLNAPYHDRFANKRPAQAPYSLPKDKSLHENLAALQAKRCASCHDVSQVTRLDWIDFRNPSQSLFLLAPLAEPAGGQGKCDPPVYQDTADPDYRAVRALVEEAARRARLHPRRDLVALENVSQ